MNLLGDTARAPWADNVSEKQMAMLSHLLALAGCVIPFGNILAPLILWMVKKDESPAIASQAKEALNFQLTATIVISVSVVVAFVLSFILIGFLLFPIIAIYGIYVFALTIIAGVKAGNGETFQYPFTVRLL